MQHGGMLHKDRPHMLRVCVCVRGCVCVCIEEAIL